MKKRNLPVLLLALLLLLTGCAKPTERVNPPAEDSAAGAESEPDALPLPDDGPVVYEPQDGQFIFTRENFPRMDGSTSLVPLAQAAAAVLLGETRDEAADLISFNRTSQSYRNLAAGSCDILVAATPSDSVVEELASMHFDYDMTRIASDALIFVVNADNPVDSLTTEQIQKIYTGEITNWSEVGGSDVDIIPFQRNAEAGSQTGMLNLVMQGLEMMDPPKDYVVDSMAGLMDAVRSFDGSAGAIGYSVYYYANDMRMAEGLKILAVDGVQPEPESIRSGDYPFLASYYVVIAADTPPDSPARLLYDWFQSEQGQFLVESQGYVSVI